MGLVFGLKSEELGLDKHFIDPIPLLKRIEGKSLLRFLSFLSFHYAAQNCKEKSF
jgi:hypothetical protein